LFDERLATEAATLSQPGAMQARLEIRSALMRAARAFFDILLHSAGAGTGKAYKGLPVPGGSQATITI